MAKKVVVSIRHLESLKGGNKELYVVSFASDLRGAETRDNVVAANNQDILMIIPEIGANAATKWMTLSVSNIFEKIKPGVPVSLSGSGILLYPNLDPKGMLGLYFAVVESDAGHRSMGKLLEGVLGSEEVKKEVKTLTSAPVVGSPLIGGLMRAATSIVPAVLKKNRDDLLFAHNHSGFDFDDYGVDAGQPVQDFQFGNELIKGTMRIRLVDQP